MGRALARGGACLCACVGAIVVVIGGGASPAWAHAELLETVPAAGAQLDAAPDQVILRYSETVDPFDDAIEVFGADGDQVETSDPTHPPGASESVAVDLPALDDGAYVVTWRVASEDSHPIRGAFTFRVGAGGDTAEAEALMDRLVAAEGGDPMVGSLFGAVRFAGFVGLVLLVGGALFIVAVWPGGALDRRARRLVAVGWVTTLVATVLSFGFQAAYSEGSGLGGIVDPGPVGDVFGTRPGRVWLIRLVLLGVVAVVATAYGRRRRPAPDGEPSVSVSAPGSAPSVSGLAIVGVLGLALLATISFAGHAGAGDLVLLALVADLVHLGGVSFWLGGLAMLFVAVLRRRDPVDNRPSTVGAAGVVVDAAGAPDVGDVPAAALPDAAAVVARFSTLAMVAVVAIVVSGVVQGWRQIRSIDRLFDTTYGRVLVVKVVLFAVMIVGAAVSRAWVQRRQSWAAAAHDDPTAEADDTPGEVAAPLAPAPPPLRTLRLSVGLETVVAGFVLAVTALLVNTVPAKDAVSPLFTTELHGSVVAAEIEVDPARAGLTDIRIVTRTHDGQAFDPVDVSASLSLPERDLPPIPLALESEGTGIYVATDADIPFPGDWTLAVNVRVSEFDQDALTTQLPVE